MWADVGGMKTEAGLSLRNVNQENVNETREMCNENLFFNAKKMCAIYVFLYIYENKHKKQSQK